MANKYIIHGATYCGDGTASNEAASAGAAGAWNDINVFTGTAPAYGALAAGDIVYIRSKSSSGANITVSYPGSAAYYFGSAAATSWTAPITWVIDNGVVWPGVDGVVTFTTSSSAFIYTFRNYNITKCLTNNSLVIEATSTSGTSWGNVCVFAGDLTGIRFSVPNKNDVYSGYCHLSSAVMRNCTFDLGRFGNTGGIGIASNTINTLINPTINALLTPSVGDAVFGQTNSGDVNSCTLNVIGGSLSGVGATTNLSLLYLVNSGRILNFVGFKYPNTVAHSTGTAKLGCGGYVFGADGGSGSVVVENWGTVDSRSDGYYPCLNATYPKSTLEKWSWKVNPSNVSNVTPARVISSKLYTASAAIKTIKVNFLVAASMAPNLENVYVDLIYVDATTGVVKTMTSRALSGSLASSSAAWTTTTYGPIALNRYEIALTTPTAIKQDTLVTVAFMTHLKSSSSNDIMFVDPDIVLS